MAGLTFGNKLSGLRLVTIISAIAGLLCLSFSSLYLDAVIKLKKQQSYKDSCTFEALLDPAIDYVCNKLVKQWLSSGILGIVFGIVQMVIGILGILFIESRWKIWTALNGLLFLSLIFTFSWAAKYDVDDKVVNLIHPTETQSKGQAFLAAVGLDFIFVFSVTLFIFIFGRRNSGQE